MRKKLLWIFVISLTLSVLSVSRMNVNAQEVHNIAITSVTPSPTLVKLGELVNIEVVVENRGTENETFDVAVYYGTSALETKTVENLEASAKKSLNFAWNTTEVKAEIYAADRKEKTYTVNATASTVPGETDTADNTFLSNSTVTIMSYYIAVVPQSTLDPTLTEGKNYTVAIYTDYNGSDIWSWQFSLSYDKNVLHGVEVTNGDLITADKDPSAEFKAGTFNNDLGKLSLTWALFFYPPMPVPITSGPGILANITFTVVGTGDSDITLGDETKLIGWSDVWSSDVDFEIVDYRTPDRGHILDGLFQNAEIVVHDIAVISVIPSPTSVERGDLVNISITVRNNGTVNEDVTVTIYRSIGPYEPGYSFLIGTTTAPNLGAAVTKSLTFVWNTTNVSVGNYTITAVASVPHDTDTLSSEEIVAVKTLEEQPLPIALILASIIGIVAVIVLVVVVYAVRRR